MILKNLIRCRSMGKICTTAMNNTNLTEGIVCSARYDISQIHSHLSSLTFKELCASHELPSLGSSHVKVAVKADSAGSLSHPDINVNTHKITLLEQKSLVILIENIYNIYYGTVIRNATSIVRCQLQVRKLYIFEVERPTASISTCG